MNLIKAVKTVSKKTKDWWGRQTPVGLATALVVEFSVPLGILFLMYLSGIKSETIAQWRNGFLGFFVVAWFTGQVVRVNRELHRKRAADSTEERLIALSAALADQAVALVNATTGGESRLRLSAHIAIAMHREDRPWSVVLELTNTGEFPVYDIAFDAREIHDPDRCGLSWNRSILVPGAIEYAVVGELQQGQYAFDGWLFARNFRYRVEVQIAVSDKDPSVAIQYGEIGGQFICVVPDDFPKPPRGGSVFNLSRPSAR